MRGDSSHRSRPLFKQSEQLPHNLEVIESAKSLWGMENKKGGNDAPSKDDLKPFCKNQTLPSCPQKGIHTIHTLSVRATCSVHPATATTP
jgi:hypothetical protein